MEKSVNILTNKIADLEGKQFINQSARTTYRDRESQTDLVDVGKLTSAVIKERGIQEDKQEYKEGKDFYLTVVNRCHALHNS